MIDPKDIDKEIKVFRQFADREPDAGLLREIQQTVRSELQVRCRRRLVLNLIGVAAAAAVVVLVVGMWFNHSDNGEQLLAFQRAVDQFVAAAESSQLTGAVSQLDEQIDAVEDMLVQWQGPESQSDGLDWQIDQLEEQLEQLADSV